MIVIGYEMEDILRVVVGIVLGLLTIFRREMSCNREFHDEETVDDNNNDRNPSNAEEDSIPLECSKLETTHDELSKRKSIRRRKSSSSLPSLTSPRTSSVVEEVVKDQYDDPTEELLESAGLFLSGGPFLAVFIAVFDHLVAHTYVYALVIFESMRSLIASFRKEVSDDKVLVEHVQDGADESKMHPIKEVDEKENQYVYNVAWNAATEYFSSISAKLGDTPPSNQTTDSNNTYPSPTRSKSTGNLLQHLSDENSRTLLMEMIAMANRGSMDVTLLPCDAQILICSYLPPNDLLSFACTSKSGRKMLDDGCEIVDGPSTCRDTALLIWKALFRRDFAWILSDWNIGREALLRSMACYDNETIQEHGSLHHRKVIGHVMSIVMHTAEMWDEIEPFNTPFTGIISTPASMKEFYFLFSEVWINYTIAGCNTTEKCLIGLHGHVVDISNFVEDHPGSTETLLLQAGRDATVFFESMGHSRSARKLALGMTVVVNAQSIHWQCTDAFSKERSIQTSPTCGLLRPSSKLLGANKNIPGFLIPLKRSRPRVQGGLHAIRSRLKAEQEAELQKAQRWIDVHLGSESLYGGIQVYYDPFCSCWRWWYMNLDFNPVFSESMD
mmetsp:Transcript_11225/g.19179  ORF Transcript_11225/g.19179 Transcript_11225/m.19179 type:complete len:613 (-) Transcript_11225:65-1903(-)